MKIPREAGIFAAVVGISAVVTAGFSWVEVALGWAVCGLLRLVLPEPERQTTRKTVAWMQLIFGIFIGTAGILAAQQAFPEESARLLITIGMSLLLWRSLIGVRDNGWIVGNVLGMLLLVLMGAILVFGLADVRWSETLPRTFCFKNAYLTICITSPWWCMRQNRENWGWFTGAAILSAGMSLLTSGILGNALATYMKMPLYRTVQTLRVFGTNQRLEALAASGTLIGAYALMCLAGEMLRSAKKLLVPDWNKKSWYGGLCGLIVFLVGGYMLLREDMAAWVKTTFWGLIPIVTLGMVFLKNNKKVLDK